MRHKCKKKKLGRSTAHREAMLAAMVCNLIEHEQIKTTVPKAKQARILAEKMVTQAKNGTLAARRRAAARLRQDKAVKKLFDELVEKFADRQGGYTRIVKLGRRSSDGSEMAILEWVTESAAKAKRRERPEAEAEENMAAPVAEEEPEAEPEAEEESVGEPAEEPEAEDEEETSEE